MKRKVTSLSVEAEEEISPVRYTSESHPHFYPLGSVINLFLLSVRCATGRDAGSVEVFGIELILSEILDFAGRSTIWTLTRFHSHRDARGAFISAHPNELDAMIAGLSAFIRDERETFRDISDDHTDVEICQRFSHDRKCGLLPDEDIRELWKLITTWYKSREQSSKVTVPHLVVKEIYLGEW